MYKTYEIRYNIIKFNIWIIENTSCMYLHNIYVLYFNLSGLLTDFLLQNVWPKYQCLYVQ